MKSYLFSLALVCLFSSTLTIAGETKVDGSVDYKNADGSFTTKKVTLIIPDDFNGNIKLAAPQKTLESSNFFVTRGDDERFLSIQFTNLPQDDSNSALILSGVYRPGSFFSGKSYTRVYENGADKTTALKEFLNAAKFYDYKLTGSFHFGKTGSGKTNKKGIRTTGSGDPNNPCPDGPCWSTGGVGRRAEYYAGGPIQNPGGPSVAASFERGVPYAWTRQGQLAAQQVGIQRSAMLYRSMYQNNGWFYGFLFW